ncbi:hypothetical protein GCM10011369_28910 [Neiella marina]|uniref:Antitoxin Xre/MbcA/ParS-like toxin-binding domain-containing protein n=1 Tax=Neiella marina TaxID=508461 RepID=A0A8J2U7Z6_9GAMM|nr:MbcA/ParS/Xre antitoxin family protein [Neiella marina]GGA85085.1 hypothetical protein GCM10011369_28910 [Neiella marina]
MDHYKSIFELARKVLGDRRLAESWMTTKLASLNNQTPEELLKSSANGHKELEGYLSNMLDVMCGAK